MNSLMASFDFWNKELLYLSTYPAPRQALGKIILIIPRSHIGKSLKTNEHTKAIWAGNILKRAGSFVHTDKSKTLTESPEPLT